MFVEQIANSAATASRLTIALLGAKRYSTIESRKSQSAREYLSAAASGAPTQTPAKRVDCRTNAKK